MVQQEQESASNEFEIGAVSKITGISQHRLRIWERRYNVVNPRRSSSNRRFYSGLDVRKLLLIKSLLDAGNSIGSIANLSIEKLEEKISSDPFLSDFSGKKKYNFSINAAAFGFDIAGKLEKSSKILKNLKLKLIETDYKLFKEKLSGQNIDLLIIELETLDSNNVQEVYNLVGSCNANHAVLIYWFCESKIVESVNKSIITMLRSPVEPSELAIVCNNLYELNNDYEVDSQSVDRIFKFSQLATIASCAPSIECECPHQLVTLIYSLLAFEKYSLECESRNLQDAKLHRFLYETTSKARSLIEKSLKKVVDVEKIEY